MLENEMDDRLAEIAASQKFAGAVPRSDDSPLQNDDSIDVGDWRPPASDEIPPAGKDFWLKTAGVIGVVVLVIAGLVALGM